ncbi:hypothetical protein [Streptomyces sp. V3I7]|uniref:hypothetical protein n=1 Tax=Streptomyces sp. V3I7 TaxID=3042278 RepID=UPI002788820D|nr:hypothetical protein [Streptomyces sp. V3I7]MDQ0994022.1 hypothetical protein [Streptomyces sp. V3I7]
MDVEITDSVGAQIVEGGLAHTPRLVLAGPFVTVGAYADQQEKEAELASTFGSAQWLWSEDDDLRFEVNDRELQSLCLYLPQDAATPDSVAQSWEHVRRIRGTLSTATNANFSAPQTTSYWVAPDATHLVCLRGSAAPADAGSLRLTVAPDLDLLFTQGKMVGWLLVDPARYLTASWEMPAPEAPAESTRSLLQRTLAMTMSSEVEAIEDGDEDAWRRLRDLSQTLHNEVEDRQRIDVLQSVIDRFIEWHAS